MTIDDAPADYAPLAKCAICGHYRSLHDTTENVHCGQCLHGGRGRESRHMFQPSPLTTGKVT